MKSFKVVPIKIHTNNLSAVFLSKEDIKKLMLNFGERVAITDKNSRILFFGQLFESSYIKEGEIGIQEEFIKNFENFPSEVCIDKKIFDATSIIEKKLKGKEITYNELVRLFKYIIKKWLAPEDIAYFVASFVNSEYNIIEAYDLTKAMVDVGDKIEWDEEFRPILNKHSIGGIPNNRISPIIVSIVASIGYTIPKLSSRAITSPAGTADTMEVFTKVDLTSKEIIKVIRKTRGCLVWGGGTNLSPVDDILIQYRREYRLDPLSLVLSSILSKHVAVGSEYIVLDLPYGPTAKLKSLNEANNFYIEFSKLAKRFGIKVKPIYTYTLEPVGNGIGPILEAIDILKILERKEDRPKDLENKALKFVVELIFMVEKDQNNSITYEHIEKKRILEEALDILDSKKALKKFKEIIEVQGKNLDEVSLNKLKPSEFYFDIKSKKSGIIRQINNKLVARIAREAGAPFFKDTGVYLYKKVGNKVEKGDILMRVYVNNELILDDLKRFAERNINRIFYIE